MGFKVIVVGAGLSGCLLVNGLLNHDVDVRLYERDSTNSKREGYQIRLGDDAISAFRMCLSEDRTSAILAKLGQSTASTSSAPSLYTSTYRQLLDLSQIPSYAKSSAINRVVLRDILAQPIMDRGKLTFGKAFSHYEIVSTAGQSDQVRVHFSDGTSDTCDILVGADGSASKVNEQVGLRNLVQITSHWSFLSKGDLPATRIEELPKQLLKGPIIVFSKGASLFYSVYLPAKEGVSPPSDEVLDYNEADASYYWGLNIPKSSIPYTDIDDIPDRRQLCLDYIKDWAPEFHTMLSFKSMNTDQGELYAAKLRASNKPAKDWREKCHDKSSGPGHVRVWLVGDAVHAMQPTRGMGGNQALLDCTDMLPELLSLKAQYDAGQPASEDTVRKSCNRYEEKMLDRSFKWVQKSGGSSMLSINLDGFLGYLVYAVGRIFLAATSMYYIITGSLRGHNKSS